MFLVLFRIFLRRLLVETFSVNLSKLVPTTLRAPIRRISYNHSAKVYRNFRRLLPLE
ncbi:hypothetical protein LEP1GSC062_3973 [Leptospira alexanderi serovar Manhao 3 str. L 60]|uniref:Uncharacterized protein n=1 Tax=Leptospira alexanderi serovar Manhao 3 str. L 60 TaxID=1049759 RepID=V6I9Y9_9LEPT|nr:hypothetical protein LEP1GSC062_3973 [Leptospira alexanderi serovar Manhao 3 str. L 60]